MGKQIGTQLQMRTWCMTENTTDNQSEDSGSNPEVRIILDLIDTPQKRFHMEQIIKNYHSYRQATMYAGRQINWFVRDLKSREIYGCIGVGSSVFICPTRDVFIGYSTQCINHLSTQDKKDYYINVKLASLRNIANNWRFTLMPHCPKGVASQVLSLLNKEAKAEWKRQYGDPLVLLETFVEPPRKGTIYKASGWLYVGMTKGDSIRATHEQNGFSSGYQFDDGHHTTTQKMVFLKPLHRYWRETLLSENRGREKRGLSEQELEHVQILPLKGQEASK